jgi:putative ABC transport system permease protein
MILLRLISLPNVRKHVLRTILTTAGIVLGVAVFLGMHAANDSIRQAFARTVDRIAGKTELQISAGETGFPEDVLERVQAMPAVRIAVPVIEAIARTDIAGEGDLFVLGVDMTGDRNLRDYDLESGDEAVVDDPLVFLAQPDSIILSSQFSSRTGFGLGSRIPLGTIEGDKHFTVRGVMTPTGLASAFGGNLAIMDIYAAQMMFGRGRTFDRIDLALASGWTLADARREIETRLGPGFQVEPPSGRGQHFEATIASFSLMMNVSSLFVLFIGMFIIYNSFAIAVTERRSEIGILRAIGASRAQIRCLFLGEGLMMGLIGSALGVVTGVALAQGITASIATLVSEVFGVAQLGREVAISPALLAWALGLGIATSVIAALIPARMAARVEPIQALKKGTYHVLSRDEHTARVAIAMLFGITSAGCLVFGRGRPVFYASYLLAMTAAVLLTPLLSLMLAHLLRPVLKWARPVEGSLAADSLIQAPRRTSGIVTALMLSVALVVAFSGMARASYGSILEWVNAVVNPDLYVMPSPSIVMRSLRFPGTMTAELEAIPGVGVVQSVREARIVFRRVPVMVLALDLLSVQQTTRARVVAGDPVEMYRAGAGGRALLVSESLAELHGLRQGETLELAAPGGVISLPIAGIIVDYSDQLGSILIDRSVFEQYWNDDSVNFFRVYVRPGADAPDVSRRVLERYAGTRQVFVLNNDDLRAYIFRITNQWFQLTYVQVAVAVLVAILGIVNTLTVSIADRRRELGVLRAVGGLRRQIRRTIRLEAVSTAALGIILGIALGALNLYFVLEIVRQDVAGMRLDYQFPVTMTLLVVPVILCAALLAAVWPSEVAIRGSLVEALEYE